MSTNLEYRAKERQRKEKVGGRSAKLNKKWCDRDLDRELKKRRHFFVGRTTSKYCSGDKKMRNASGHQSNAR